MAKAPEVAELEEALEQYLAGHPSLAEALRHSAQTSELAAVMWSQEQPPDVGSRVISTASTNLKTKDAV